MRPGTRTRTISAIAAVVLVVSLLPGGATAQETSGAARKVRDPEVRVRQAVPSVTPTGTIEIAVDVDLDAETPYVESRLRLYSPSGRLLYQKTEVRNDAPEGVTTFSYERELTGLGVAEGRYPIEIRVLATESEPTVIEDRLLVFDPERPPLPLAIVIRLRYTPGRDAEGLFVIDPAEESLGRAEVASLATVLLRRPQSRISLALPPIALADWTDIVDGFTLATAAGVEEVSPESPVVADYASTLATLKTVIASDRVEVLHVPFAEPDVGGLMASGGLGDLAMHLERGRAVIESALETSASPGVTVLGDTLPRSAPDILDASGIQHAVLSADSLEPAADATETAGGLWNVGGGFEVLATDGELGTALADGFDSEVADILFDRFASEETSGPVAAIIEIGTGAPTTAADIDRILSELARLPWVGQITVSEAAEADPAGSTRLVDTVKPLGRAPVDYWQEVARARVRMQAVIAAAGLDDTDIRSGLDSVLMAESGCWAGPDLRWALADRGRSFIGHATRTADSVLGGIGLDCQDVTLPGRDGKVPVSVTNATGRPLVVTLEVEATGLDLTGETTMELTLDRPDTYVNVPVQLSNTFSGDLTLSVYAGQTSVAAKTVTVAASYLDRLAIVGIVVIVLLGMLFFIIRRVRRLDAGTIPSGSPTAGGSPDGDPDE